MSRHTEPVRYTFERDEGGSIKPTPNQVYVGDDNDPDYKTGVWVPSEAAVYWGTIDGKQVWENEEVLGDAPWRP